MAARKVGFSDMIAFDPDAGTIAFLGLRVLLVQAHAMGALRKELIDTLGTDIAKVILTRFGYSCGWEDATHLRRKDPDSDPVDFVREGPRLHMAEGVARVTTNAVLFDPASGTYTMSGNWAMSYEAEQHVRLFGPASEPVCWTLAGYASGFSSVAFTTPMICIEDTCVGRGDPVCAWRLMPASACGPEHQEKRRLFAPLNLQEQLDLLERKVAARTMALSASEARYRDLVDNLPEIIFSLDPEARLVHLNLAGRERLGLDPGACAVPLADVATLAHRRRVIRVLQQVAESRSEGRVEVVLRSRDGPPMAAQMQIRPVYDGDTLSGFRGLAIDISARQAKEKRLAEYADTLKSQLATATRLAGLGQFASGLAHEINNPMGLISGYAEELLERLDSIADLPELRPVRDGLRTIQEQAYRCKFITQNVLSFAREQTVNLETTDVAALVREKIAFFCTRSSAQGIEVRLDLDERLPQMRTDPILLGQVLLNLLKNAADAMAGQGRLDVAARLNRGRMRIEVADTGPGLPAGAMEKCFDPFFTTKAPDQGSGLGLSICYGIVRSLDGTITCGNRRGGGAWFRVSLPLRPREPAA